MRETVFSLPEEFDESQRFYASLMRSIFLFTAVVGFTGPVLLEIIDFLTNSNANELKDTVTAVTLGGVSVILLVVLQKGYVRLATAVFLGTGLLGISALIFTNQGVTDPLITIYFFTIMVSGLILERRYPIIIATLATVAMFIFYLAEVGGWVDYPEQRIIDPAEWIVMPMAFFMVAFILRYFIATTKRRDEQIHQSNLQLQHLNQNLEELVYERTQVLERTVEIGNKLTAILDSDQLVAQMVAQIQDSFNYYHVHVYLLEESGEWLAMVAGSGEPGKLMLDRGHRLRLDQGLVGQAARQKQPILIEDVLQEESWLPNPLLPETAAEIAVPIMLGDELLGVLDVQNDRKNSLSQTDVVTLQVLSNQMGIALRNARDFSQMRYQAQNEAVINALNGRIQAINDIDQLFAEVVKTLNQTLTLYEARCQVGPFIASETNKEEQNGRIAKKRSVLLDWSNFLDGIHRPTVISYESINENNRLVQSRALTHAITYPIEVEEQPIGEIALRVENGRLLTPVEVEMVRKVRELVSNRLETIRLLAMTERYRQEAEAASRRLTRQAWQQIEQQSPQRGYAFDSRQLVPFESRADDQLKAYQQPIEVLGHAIGQIEVDASEGLSIEQQALITAVSEQLSNHMENLRLTEQIEQALLETEIYSARLRQLNELSAQMTSAESSEEVIKLVVEQSERILEADRVSIALLDESHPNALLLAAQSGHEGGTPAGTMLPLEDSPMESAIKFGKIEKGFFEGDGQTFDARFVPLFTLGEVLGTFNLAKSQKIGFSAQDEQLINQIASLTSSALEAKQLLEQNQLTLRETEMLYTIVSQLNEAGNLTELLHAIINSPIAEGFARASLNRVMVDEQNRPNMVTVIERVVREDSPNDPVTVGTNIPIDAMPFKDKLVAHPTEAIVVENIEEDGRLADGIKRIMRQLQDESMLILPLYVRGRWIGLVRIAWSSTQTFSEQNLRLLTIIAEQASVVANQLTLYEEVNERAALLEELAEIEGYLSQGISENDILEAVRRACNEPDMLSLFHFENDRYGNPALFKEVAHWANGSYHDRSDRPIALTDTHPIFNEWQQNSNQIIWVEDVEGYAEMDEVARQTYINNGVHSFLLMPLISFGRWQGALEVHWRSPHHFSEQERFLLKQLLEPIAANVASKRSLAETEMLYQVSDQLNEAESYIDVLHLFADFSPLAADANIALVAYFNKAWTEQTQPEWVDIVGQTTNGRAVRPPIQRFFLTEFPDLRQLKQNSPVIIPDVASDETLGPESKTFLMETAQSKSALFFPLVVGQTWFGYVAFLYSDQQTLFSPEVQKLHNLIEQAAVAIQGIRFLRQVERRAQREQQIRQIATKVRNSTNVETILKTAVQEVGKVLGRQTVVTVEKDNGEEPNGPQNGLKL